jgi:hypothetical protein
MGDRSVVRSVVRGTMGATVPMAGGTAVSR